MANFKQNWDVHVPELPEPALIKKDQYAIIKAAIDEIQEKVITGVTNSDKELEINYSENILSIDFSKNSGDTPGITSGVIQLASTITWDGTSLKYVPVTLYIGDGGRIYNIELGSAITIDSAEECACE